MKLRRRKWIGKSDRKCEVCGEPSDDLEPCGMCGKMCCRSCLASSGLCTECDEVTQDEVGL